jgi:hypothetical protein
MGGAMEIHHEKKHGFCMMKWMDILVDLPATFMKHVDLPSSLS